MDVSLKMKLLALGTFVALSGGNATGSDSLHGGTPATIFHSAEKIDDTKTIFPMEHYPQNVDSWVQPAGTSALAPLLSSSKQNAYFSKLLTIYFGEESPWDASHIKEVLKSGSQKNIEENIQLYLSSESTSWGENFRKNAESWKNTVRDNIVLPVTHYYDPSARAISVRSTLVRALPTLDPAYDNPATAGQGYPFDNLQVSALRPGTPVYVLATSKDRSWKYVETPAVTGWVKGNDLAGVDEAFVSEWSALARQNLGAFIKEPVSVHSALNFYFLARPGTVLPYKAQNNGTYLTAVPVRNADGFAQITWVEMSNTEFIGMPWKMNRKNLTYLMRSMAGKPYGWGNSNFYNDCSAELRSLLMPFGIFLPRHSSEEVKIGHVVDLSDQGPDERISFLQQNGRPFTTLVYIDGHIMLYIGNTEIEGKSVPMTYQNVWGLHTKDSRGRAIIGGSVFFPILAEYPENPDLLSLAGKPHFKLGFLD